jgi:two-component system sensor histidine kinase YesM
MFKLFRKFKIRNQMMVLALTIVLISVIAFFAVNRKIAEVIQDNNKAYIREITVQTAQNIDRSIADIGKIVTNISYSPVIQQYLTETSDEGKYTLSLSVNSFLGNMSNLKGGIKNIIILGFNGNLYGNLDYLKLSDRQISTLQDHNEPYCSGMYYDGQNTFIIVGCAVYDLQKFGNSSQKIGVAAILVDTASLGANISSFLNANIAKAYLFDRYNTVFESNTGMSDDVSLDLAQKYGMNSTGNYLVRQNRHEYIITVSDLASLGGKMVSVVSKDQLLSGVSKSTLLVLCSFILSLFFCAFLFVIIVNNIINPLEIMIRFLEKIRAGNLKQLKSRVSLEGYAEISQLAQSFNSMLDEIDHLTCSLVSTNTRLYEAELLKQKSEYEFLKSQINPHFLYNTLESIKSISNIKGVYEVRDMSVALAQILRYSIKGEDFVLLADEIEIVKAYLRIHLIRFKNKFEFVYDIPDEFLEAQMIKMLLQPLVENAIYHGLELKVGKARLTIRCRAESREELVIYVIDNGVGISKENLESLRHSLEEFKKTADPENHLLSEISPEIGIKNVAKRIALFYGNPYGIEIESTENEGTTVAIRIPFRRKTEDG